MISDKEYVYIGTSDEKFLCIDPINKKVVWEKEVGGLIDSAACIYDDQIVVGAADSILYSFDLDTGEDKWQLDLNVHGSPTLSSIFWWEANVNSDEEGHFYS